jgi:hypothetical protein
MADPVKPVRKGMQQEAPDEFVGREEVGAGVLDFAPGDEVYGCAGAPTDCRSPINSNSTPTFWLSSRAEPGNQHRRIFDAVARTASSLKRDRRFADSPLEQRRFELSVPP